MVHSAAQSMSSVFSNCITSNCNSAPVYEWLQYSIPYASLFSSVSACVLSQIIWRVPLGRKLNFMTYQIVRAEKRNAQKRQAYASMDIQRKLSLLDNKRANTGIKLAIPLRGYPLLAIKEHSLGQKDIGAHLYLNFAFAPN
ncbi:hypothetical protein OROMI_017006 [Orobanche minor]